MKKITIATDSTVSTIHVGTFSPVAEDIKTLLISDSNVAPLFAKQVSKLLKPVAQLILPAGEMHKNFSTVENICRYAAQHHLDRYSRFVALGGGVVSDLTGFAAAIYQRGIRFDVIATTLLSMVDASVGGKTAADLPEGKNLIGAFHQPTNVWIDSSFLATLPEREIRNGLAEIIKTAVILDENLFNMLANQSDNRCSEMVISRCIELKSQIVAQDEHEHGCRALLNYGHSFGHAIECLSNFSFSHGEAVALGMSAAGLLAKDRHWWNECDYIKQQNLLISAGLPVKLSVNYDPYKLLEMMRNDKKNRNGEITLIIPRKIGNAQIMPSVAADDIISAWEGLL